MEIVIRGRRGNQHRGESSHAQKLDERAIGRSGKLGTVGREERGGKNRKENRRKKGERKEGERRERNTRKEGNKKKGNRYMRQARKTLSGDIQDRGKHGRSGER